MKRIGWMIFCLMLMFSPYASALTILNDDFTTTTQVNSSATTAYYDASNTLYRLPKIPAAQSIALAEYGTEYAVVDGNTVKFYQYDGGTNSMVNMPAWDIAVTNPLGLAMRKDVRSLWSFTDTDVKRYDFDGSGMVYNPTLSVLGLSGVISVATQPYQDDMVVMTKDGSGKGVISYYQVDGSGGLVQNSMLSFNTNLVNPLTVTMVSGSPDLVVTTETGSHYFSFTGSGYTENAGLSKVGLTNVSGHDQHDTTLTTMENGNINRYLYDGSSMQYTSVLSSSNTDQPIALSTRSDNYDYAYITESGEVKYFTFDGSTMVQNPLLSTTGLSVAGAYSQPRIYQSVVVNPGKSCDLVRVTTTESNDPGSSIQYSVSTDGGSSWTNITAGTWNSVPEGQQFVVRATLTSSVKTSTPKLLDIRMEATKIKLYDLEVTNILFPPPGQTYPTVTFPFQVRAGSEFTFQVKTDGYVDSLTAIFSNGDSVVMTPVNPISDEANVWWGRYTPSVTETTGTTVGVTLNANFLTWSRNLTQNPFYQTNGTVSMSTGIKLVQ